MQNKKSITDEQLIAALLSFGTVKQAAEHLNVSRRTVYNIMRTESFEKVYEGVAKDSLALCMLSLQARLDEAVEVIVEIMEDKSINPQTRLLAAQTIVKGICNIREVSERLRLREEEIQWG